ncbi:unnamed protein product [Chrysoparadoxa australica]
MAKRISKVTPPLHLPSNEVLMEDMALYAERVDLEGMMQEYLRRVLLDMPDDPIDFLIREINDKPYLMPSPIEERDLRPEEMKNKFLDTRSTETKEALLQEVFDMVEKVPGEDLVQRAQLVVTLKKQPGLLLERFPKHQHEIERCIDRMQVDKRGVNVQQFQEACLAVLAAPGGR